MFKRKWHHSSPRAHTAAGLSSWQRKGSCACPALSGASGASKLVAPTRRRAAAELALAMF